MMKFLCRNLNNILRCSSLVIVWLWIAARAWFFSLSGRQCESFIVFSLAQVRPLLLWLWRLNCLIAYLGRPFRDSPRVPFRSSCAWVIFRHHCMISNASCVNSYFNLDILLIVCSVVGTLTSTWLISALSHHNNIAWILMPHHTNLAIRQCVRDLGRRPTDTRPT